MYDFMYVDSEKIPVERKLLLQFFSSENYKKMSTEGTVPKHWLGFRYIHSEDYELDQNFDDT